MKPWKVRKFFEDILYDLRSRGLLPVVILLLVALVAVPMLISRGSSDSAAPVLQPAAGTADAAPEAKTAVVSYSPGIRSYKQRLDELSPKDPFRQQFAQPAADASNLTVTNTAAPAGGSSSTGSSGGSTTSDTTSTGSTGTGKKQHKKQKKSKTRYVYSVNVLAGDVNLTLTPFKDVPALTPLPSQDASAVVYYGLSSDFKKALFLVSNKVDALTGAGTCVPAPDDCSLLALAPGQGEDLHYSTDGKTYRLVVAEIKRTAK
jgi:uncharacterized protein (DUF697 family)